ncbi:MAG: hypothetical protein R2695_06770 [Acidimicrobiales bacterium]
MQPTELIGLEREPFPAQHRRHAKVGRFVGGEPDGVGRRLGIGESGDGREDAVHDHRSECQPDLVLDGEGGLDQLVDRGLLGDADEHGPAAGGVLEHLEHLDGLTVEDSRPSGVPHRRRRPQELHGMACRGRVDDDQVGVVVLLERFDAAEHEESLIPGVAVATISSSPVLAMRFAIRANPWLANHSINAWSGVIERQRTEPPSASSKTVRSS